MKELQDLYACYYHDLYDWFFYRCASRYVAEDLTQDTFVQIIRSLNSFQGKSSERTWIFAIAKHVWCDYLRKKKDVGELPEQIATAPKEESAILDALLDMLKKKDERSYQIFVLRMEGYQYEEIAQRLHCTSASVRVLFHRSKLWIQKEWEV